MTAIEIEIGAQQPAVSAATQTQRWTHHYGRSSSRYSLPTNTGCCFPVEVLLAELETADWKVSSMT